MANGRITFPGRTDTVDDAAFPRAEAAVVGNKREHKDGTSTVLTKRNIRSALSAAGRTDTVDAPISPSTAVADKKERRRGAPTAFTKQDIRSALTSIHLDNHRVYDIPDEGTVGLILRIRKRSVVWAVQGRLGRRGKKSTWRIAAPTRDDDVDDIRRRARRAKLMLENGEDPATWLRDLEHGGPVVRHFDEDLDGWTWGKARNVYLDYVATERAPATHADYRKTLNSSYVKAWEKRLVTSITDDDVSALQTAIAERGFRRQATHTLAIVKACLNYIAKHQPKSRLRTSPARDVEPLPVSRYRRAVAAGNKYVPSPADLGALPWQLSDVRVTGAARLAVLMVLLTAQRRETVVTARLEHFEEAAEGALWKIPPVYTKSKREEGHVVPLPPLSWSVVRAAMALSGASGKGWLFPQLRLRRAADSGEGHMAARLLNRVMEEVGSQMRPHVVRRAFATHGQARLGITPAETKAILDHAEGLSGDVTAAYYTFHDGTHFKWGVMRKWEGWLKDLIRSHRPVGVTIDLPMPFPTEDDRATRPPAFLPIPQGDTALRLPSQ